MSRKITSKACALLASSFLLFTSIGCNPGTLTAPSPAPQTVVESPNFIRVLSTSKDSPELSLVPGAEKIISADEGGRVVCGPFKLEIPANALDQDTEITIDIIRDGTLSVELGPHGIQFNVPVVLSMDLEGTNAEGMADQSSTVWYNEDTDTYELMQKLLSDDDNVIYSELNHFSKYKGHIL